MKFRKIDRLSERYAVHDRAGPRCSGRGYYRSGFWKQLLLTNDIRLKCMLTEYGGQGYSYIFRNIVPMIAEQGIPEKYLRETVLHGNPLRMLSGYQAAADIHRGKDNYNSIRKEELK